MTDSTVIHTLYMGHDNEQALNLRVGGENLSLAQYDNLLRVRVDLRPQAGGAVIPLDSEDVPGLFRWGGEDGARVVIDGAKLEDVPDLLPGSYRGRVIAYSGNFPNGVVFADYPEYLVVIFLGGEPA
jgi:hypothetical protein